MPIKKFDRPTADKYKRERKRFKKIASVFEKPNITRAEKYIANYHRAMVDTLIDYNDFILKKNNKEYPLNRDALELLIWLSQFEFIEWRFAAENYIYATCVHNGGILGVGSHCQLFNNKFDLLYHNGFIEGHEDYVYEYSELEQGDGYTKVINKETEATYNLSYEGREIVKTFYEHLDQETIFKNYTRRKFLIWKTQESSDFNDYRSMFP